MDEGWTAAYAGGSAKRVGGWWQAKCAVCFHKGSPRNFGAPVRRKKDRVSAEGSCEAFGMPYGYVSHKNVW